MKNKKTIFTLALLTSTVAFSNIPDIKKTPVNDALHMDWLDTSISPSQNFYAYANGSWQKNNPIPPEYASWGSFNLVNEKVQKIVHEMLIKASEAKAQPGSIEQKVGDFYYSGMDEKTINQLGATPLKSEFSRIESINNLTDLQQELIHLHQIGVDALFNFASMQDFKDSSLMIAALFQSGLSLPDRDYYLKDDPKFKQIREAYVKHVAKMFELLGDSPQVAAQKANTVMDIETQLAKASMSQVEQRNPEAIYHIKNVKDLDKDYPNFSWSNYFAAKGQGTLKTVNLGMPEFFKVSNDLLKTIPLNDWKIYLRWQLLDNYASFLSKPFVDQNFKMTSVLTGAKQLLPRWKRVLSTESGALGFAIGKMYVDKYFSPQSKQQILEILKNIRAVLEDDLQNLSWMTPTTRTAALKKLSLMEERIGYPSKWWDYSSLKVDRDSYVGNIMRATEFLEKRDLDKIGKPIDRTEWGMTPQTINAYYDASMNNLNMPAGILQSPFFDPNAPAAVNYGAIGFVMGHEMTHGFDDQGAKFNGQGNLENWWTKSDLTQFNKATLCVAEQFSKYKVEDNLPVQGKLVVGEAVADLGGITLAYRAFHRSKEYKEAQSIDGMTPDQQFFLGTAHVWAMNIRPEQLRNQVTTDPHPPAIYRVNGTLANIPEFQAAFNIPSNSPMVSAKRCVIW